MRVGQRGLRGGWVAAEDDPHGAQYPTVAKTCSAQQKFPISPAAFGDELATRVFTNGADADFVKAKYAETFQQVVAVLAFEEVVARSSAECVVTESATQSVIA